MDDDLSTLLELDAEEHAYRHGFENDDMCEDEWFFECIPYGSADVFFGGGVVEGQTA